MSALEPVILNEVKQAKLMIQAVSDSAGTTTVSIPVRQGHSFADGDIALYDTERGDLHDGRGEFYAYFSPESGGASYVAHSATPSGYHERDDGSFVIAAIFRPSSGEGTTTSSAASRLEVGYRTPAGVWSYASLSLPDYALGYYIDDFRLIPMSSSEYFVVAISKYSNNQYLQAASIRITNGLPSVGAFTQYDSGSLGASGSCSPLFLRGNGVLWAYVTGINKWFKFESSSGALAVTSGAGPASSNMYQLDSKSIFFPSLNQIVRVTADGVATETVSASVTSPGIVPAPTLNNTPSRDVFSVGYDPELDIIPGIFCPESLGTGRLYDGIYSISVSDTVITVRKDGFGVIAHDKHYYLNAPPLTAMNPGYGASNSRIPSSYFCRKGIFVYNPNKVTTSVASRTKINGVYFTGGLAIMRQSGLSVPVGIAGGKAQVLKYDAADRLKSNLISVSEKKGLVRQLDTLTGKMRHRVNTYASIYDNINGLTDVNQMIANMSGPVVAVPQKSGSYYNSSGGYAYLWACADGVWSLSWATFASTSTVTVAAASSKAYLRLSLWLERDIQTSQSSRIDMFIYDGVAS